MEFCKNCSQPIMSEGENQFYCSYKCLQDYLQKRNTEDLDPPLVLESQTESAWIVWFSIIAMLVGLVGVLLLISAVSENVEIALFLFMFFSGIIIYFVLNNIMPSDQFNELLTFSNNSKTWRLIGIVLALDVFLVLPIHIAITTLVFPDATQQEVITMFDDASNSSVLILAFTISILTPFAEEFLFRGFILGMLMKRYSANQSIIISSIIFAVAHEPIAMFLAFGGGLLYGWIRVKTGSIFPSMIAHAIWNSFITLVVLFY